MCFLAQSARSQSCKEIEYAYENQSRLNCEKLKEKRQGPNGVVMRELCVGLFTERDHRLVRYAQSNENGVFAFDTEDLPDGEYRLVGRAVGFCPANAQLRI